MSIPQSNGRFRLSAFADELGPDVGLQVGMLARLGVAEIQLRGAWGRNVMDLTPAQIREMKQKADDANLGFHAIGSPIGKVDISTPAIDSVDAVIRAAVIARAVDTDRVRVFSFYYADKTPEQVRGQVLDRLAAMCEAASEEGVRLIHENEKDIYGDTAARCEDLLDNVPGLGLCFDFANFVQCGEDTLECWRRLKRGVVYFDVKDAIAATGSVVPAGQGDGQLEAIFRDALAGGFRDRFNLEPHLSGGGQFGGSTAPELFELAVESLRGVLMRASGEPDSGASN